MLFAAYSFLYQTLLRSELRQGAAGSNIIQPAEQNKQIA